jgi:WD40 repeat protein
VTHVGIGHSAPITGIKISPDQTMIASISSDGAVFIWHFPPAKPPTADINATARDTIDASLGAHHGDEHDDIEAVTDEIAERFRC